jgi:beta-glucosidase
VIYEQLINEMTLEEKASLLSGEGNFTTKAIKRLGIPSMFLSDGPHGLRKQAGAADHLGLNASLPATCYPPAATMANSWDIELGEKLGRFLGDEAVAQCVSVLLGPGLNMKRSPLCGRNFEYFSEDPYLAGKMAAAYIRGIQSRGVAACPKHFAANNQELLRMHSDSIVDERTFREIYLTGFEIAVKEGKPLSIMSAYNKINGVYANEDKHLLRDILVDEWGFNGFVVTDWGASDDRVAGLVAGNHLEMPATGGDSDREIVEAVQSGRIPERLVDQRVDEYLKVLFATVIPKSVPNMNETNHHQFARKAAEATIVLLKNEDEILPLKPGTKIAVIGDFADKPRYQGFGSSIVNPTHVDKPLNSLMASNLDFLGFSSGLIRNGGEDVAKRQAAADLAVKADVVLLYLGLDELSESEGLDRKHMRIHQNQVSLLEAVAAVNPNVVVILSGGSVIEMPWIDRCKAVIHGYLGGQAGAGAMVDALTGKINPSGKLSETWPLVYEDTPAYKHFPGLEKTVEYREGPFIGYRYYETAEIPVRFPFGFGLSYTTYAYSDIQANEKSVQFNLTNSGSVAGSEIVQIYVSPSNSKLFRPRSELKGFTKIHLEPGESKSITIPLDDKAFRYFNVKTGQFEIESGIYFIQVGASISDIRLRQDITIEGTSAPIPCRQDELPSYYSGHVSEVSQAEFEILLGRPVPESRWDRSKPLDRNDTFSQLFYAKSWYGRLIYKVLIRIGNKAGSKGLHNQNIHFIINSTFRSLDKLTNGAASKAMTNAILEISNGHFFKGLGHLAGACFRKGRAVRDTNRKLSNAGH